jgi:hypothetical protein
MSRAARTKRPSDIEPEWPAPGVFGAQASNLAPALDTIGDVRSGAAASVALGLSRAERWRFRPPRLTVPTQASSTACVDKTTPRPSRTLT